MTQPKIPTGRIPKLTPEMQERICDVVRKGNYIETAAAAVGIHQSTLRRWMARGRKELQRLELEPHTEPDQQELLYLLFYESLAKAEAEAEIEGIKQIRSHGGEDWKAVAWRLERRYYNRWGRKQAFEHTGGSEPVKIQKIKIGDKEIEF